jgi:hypothetical protein
VTVARSTTITLSELELHVLQEAASQVFDHPDAFRQVFDTSVERAAATRVSKKLSFAASDFFPRGTQ